MLVVSGRSEETGQTGLRPSEGSEEEEEGLGGGVTSSCRYEEQHLVAIGAATRQSVGTLSP